MITHTSMSQQSSEIGSGQEVPKMKHRSSHQTSSLDDTGTTATNILCNHARSHKF